VEINPRRSAFYSKGSKKERNRAKKKGKDGGGATPLVELPHHLEKGQGTRGNLDPRSHLRSVPLSVLRTAITIEEIVGYAHVESDELASMGAEKLGCNHAESSPASRRILRRAFQKLHEKGKEGQIKNT